MIGSSLIGAFDSRHTLKALMSLPLRGHMGCIRNRPLYPHSLFPTLVHSDSSLEGVNGNEGVNSAPEGLPLCIVFFLFNNHLKRAAPVRLKDLS